MKHLLIISGIAVLSGCAQIPHVEQSYFGTKTSVSIKTTQTITCSENHVGGDTVYSLHMTSSMVPTITYSADYSKKFTYDYSKLNGLLSDGTATIEFYGDGRLKSVNSSASGNGDSIVSTLVSFYTGLKSDDKDDATITSICQSVIAVSGDKKPLTISGLLELSGSEIDVNDDGEPVEYFTILSSDNNIMAPILTQNKPKVTIAMSDHSPRSSETSGDEKATNVLIVQTPASYIFTVNWLDFTGETYASENFSVLVPEQGSTKAIPMPEPSLFGKIDMELSLAESGMITKLKYGTTDVASGSDSINSLIETVTSTTSEKAAAIQAEADLIKQQQRLIKCKADPENCE